MIDELIELILELVLEGAIESAASEKVPLWLRILLGLIVFLFFAALLGSILMICIREHEPHLAMILMMLLLGIIFIMMRKNKRT